MADNFRKCYTFRVLNEYMDMLKKRDPEKSTYHLGVCIGMVIAMHYLEAIDSEENYKEIKQEIFDMYNGKHKLPTPPTTPEEMEEIRKKCRQSMHSSKIKITRPPGYEPAYITRYKAYLKKLKEERER